MAHGTYIDNSFIWHMLCSYGSFIQIAQSTRVPDHGNHNVFHIFLMDTNFNPSWKQIWLLVRIVSESDRNSSGAMSPIDDQLWLIDECIDWAMDHWLIDQLIINLDRFADKRIDHSVFCYVINLNNLGQSSASTDLSRLRCMCCILYAYTLRLGIYAICIYIKISYDLRNRIKQTKISSFIEV